MKFIRAKTLREKLDLFIKIADKDRNGRLDWKEVNEICSFNLRSCWKGKDQGDWKSLIDYFTKLIFTICGVPADGEIP
jgi:hypothetical protein